MKNVTQLNAGWSTLAQVAKQQGIAERTAWTWLRVGKIEKMDTDDGCRYRAVPTDSACRNDAALLARITAVESAVARMEKLERKNADLLARIVELENVNAELLVRFTAIEHATGWHVAIDGILESRKRKLARLKR